MPRSMIKPNPTPLSEDQIAYLDDFLSSGSSPENCFLLSDLDGYLTGVAIGPELIRPSEWLPVIWGGDEPAFDTPNIAEQVYGLIIDRYNYVLRILEDAPGDYSPWFWEKPDGVVIAMDWAEGFLEAVNLRQEAWQVLLDDKDASQVIVPIAAFWPTKDGQSTVETLGGETENLIDELTHQIPQAVIDIHQFWKSRK